MQQALGARQVAVGREERDVGLARLRDFRFARALRGVGVDGVVEMRRRYKDDIASSSFYIREIPNACAFVTRRAAFFWWTLGRLRVVVRRPACCALRFRASLRARRECGVYVWPRLPQLLVQ